MRTFLKVSKTWKCVKEKERERSGRVGEVGESEKEVQTSSYKIQ